VGAVMQSELSGTGEAPVDSLGFRLRSQARRRSTLSQAANERTDALPSHRYSTPRYRPSAHALDTGVSGVHTLLAGHATGSATATMAPLRTPTMTSPARAVAVKPGPAKEMGGGFASSLLRHIRADEQTFVLRYVQPGLVGLIDGTLSTLAPIFAVALLSSPHAALLVGLATALGAGISMGLSEALSDDGGQTGRGSAITRGSITGVMTTVGGVFHALPFLIPDRTIALVLAAIVVAIELATIALVRKRYLEVSLRTSLIQVVLGGVLIVGVGLWLGGL
jgi:erythrin-vacuolar iron transport family protein